MSCLGSVLNPDDFTVPDVKEFWFLTAVVWWCCSQ